MRALIPQLGQRGSSKSQAGKTLTKHPARLRHDFGIAVWILLGEDADLVLLFIGVRFACVLIIVDMGRSRRAVGSTFGPLIAGRLWPEGLDAYTAASSVLVRTAPGARMDDPALARCSIRFERPDPYAPQMRHMPSRQALDDGRWVWKEGDVPWILALVRLPSVKTLCSPAAYKATGNPSSRGVRPDFFSRPALVPLMRT